MLNALVFWPSNIVQYGILVAFRFSSDKPLILLKVIRDPQ